MEKQTKKRHEYLTSPAVIISFCIALFWFGTTRWTLNSRINRLEDLQKEIDVVEIQTTLTSIQKDISRIKLSLDKLQK